MCGVDMVSRFIQAVIVTNYTSLSLSLRDIFRFSNDPSVRRRDGFALS